ncbi:MAG: hypothetical protein ACI865_002534, partial [Flavobacteriaceae bacterium]
AASDKETIKGTFLNKITDNELTSANCTYFIWYFFSNPSECATCKLPFVQLSNQSNESPEESTIANRITN